MIHLRCDRQPFLSLNENLLSSQTVNACQQTKTNGSLATYGENRGAKRVEILVVTGRLDKARPKLIMTESFNKVYIRLEG